MNRSYVLISPGRNEAQYMRQTLDSVIAQTVRPTLWVIVDDGSTDETPAIDRKSTRLNSSHIQKSRMPSSA